MGLFIPHASSSLAYQMTIRMIALNETFNNQRPDGFDYEKDFCSVPILKYAYKLAQSRTRIIQVCVYHL